MDHSQVPNSKLPYSYIVLCNDPVYGSSDGVMGSKISINKPSYGLSNDDKCAFIKLHCPNLVSVEENIIKEEITDKYPNPS